MVSLSDKISFNISAYQILAKIQYCAPLIRIFVSINMNIRPWLECDFSCNECAKKTNLNLTTWLLYIQETDYILINASAKCFNFIIFVIQHASSNVFLLSSSFIEMTSYLTSCKINICINSVKIKHRLFKLYSAIFITSHITHPYFSQLCF